MARVKNEKEPVRKLKITLGRDLANELNQRILVVHRRRFTLGAYGSLREYSVILDGLLTHVKRSRSLERGLQMSLCYKLKQLQKGPVTPYDWRDHLEQAIFLQRALDSNTYYACTLLDIENKSIVIKLKRANPYTEKQAIALAKRMGWNYTSVSATCKEIIKRTNSIRKVRGI